MKSPVIYYINGCFQGMVIISKDDSDVINHWESFGCLEKQINIEVIVWQESKLTTTTSSGVMVSLVSLANHF